MPISPQTTIQTRNPVQCNKESDSIKNSKSNQYSSNFIVQQNDQEKNNDSHDYNNSNKFSSKNEYRRMFFMPNELNVSQIVDNPKVKKKF